MKKTKKKNQFSFVRYRKQLFKMKAIHIKFTIHTEWRIPTEKWPLFICFMNSCGKALNIIREAASLTGMFEFENDRVLCYATIHSIHLSHKFENIY